MRELIRRVALPELFLGLLALAIAAVFVARMITGAIHDAKHAHDTVTVTGSAVKPIDADLVQWTLNVQTVASTRAEAALQLQRDLLRVQAFLRQAGIGSATQRLSVVSTDELVERLANHRTRRRYQVAEAITIQTRQLNTIEKVSTRVTELIEQGIDVSPEPPQYLSTELRTAKLEALRAATADARQRAQTLVDGLGGTLGRLRDTSLGVYQITPRFSTEVTDYGVNDTSSREKDVRAVLSATFDVKS